MKLKQIAWVIIYIYSFDDKWYLSVMGTHYNMAF